MTLRAIASVGILASLMAGAGSLCAAAAGPQSAGAPDAAGQEVNSPSGAIRVTTKLISVNVIVRDKHGQPVTDLTKNDFVLLEGKKPQPIQIFSMEKPEVEPQPAHGPPPDTYSNEIGGGDGTPSNLTIILLDSLNTPFFDRAYPRNQVRKLLLTLQPQDRVALYALGPRLHVLHDFTSDASSLLAALKENKDYELLDVDVTQRAAANAVNHQLESLADENLAAQSEQLGQNRAAATAEALRTIADHVSYLPGRKNLIWISAEFPFYIESNNLERSPDGKKLAYPSENEMVERALTNAHIAVYPIDARGLLAGGVDEIANKSPDKLVAEMAESSNMEMLARRTGGHAYRDNNGIAGSIRQTIDGSRVTYQLGFYPEDVAWDGSFHKLQVKVNRRDVQVQARDGYFALAQPNLTREMVRELLYQAAHSPINATGIRFSLHVAPVSPAADKKLRLSFSLAPSQFAFASQNGELKDAVDIAFVTMDANNHALQTTVLPLPFTIDAQTYEHLVQAGLPLAREVVIPPNASKLQVIVLDEGNGQVGSVLVPLAPYLSKTAN
jgi:VWFA-related protein